MTLPVYYANSSQTVALPDDLVACGVNAVALVDLNGDGALDAIFSYYDQIDGGAGGVKIPIGVVLGDGAGGFTEGASAIFGSSIPETDNVRAVVIADFNGDGRNDLFMADHGLDAEPLPGAQDTLLMSSGLTGYVDATSNLPGVSDYSHSATAADIDGDGDIDLMVGTLIHGPEPWQHFLTNDGAGNFTEADWRAPFDVLNRPSNLLFDADNDGDVDLFAGAWLSGSRKTAPSQLLSNDGTGNFSHWTDLPYSPNAPFEEPRNPGTNAYVQNSQALDLNGDGLLDLVLVFALETGNDIQVLINRGEGRFSEETLVRSTAPVTPFAQVPAFADVNGDGHLDMVLDSAPDPVLFNDGGGYFFKMPAWAFGSSSNDEKAKAADFNADGRLDFLVTRGGGGGFEDFDILLGIDAGLVQDGDADADGLMGDDSSETFSGLGGDDVIFGAQGNDTASGGDGADTLIGGTGDDSLSGGDEADFLAGGAGDDTLNGGGATDTASYRDALAGVKVSLAKTAAQNTVGSGTDRLNGIEDLIGSSHDDALTGSATANRLDGAEGKDTLTGGGGDDTLRGGMGDDKISGGSGVDWASYADAIAGVSVSLAKTKTQNTGGAGKDTVSGIEGLLGSAFADRLIGSSGAETLSGGDGADILQGGKGDDALIGGAGVDAVSFADATAAITLTFKATSLTVAGLGTDTLSSIEGVIGSKFADKLTGGNGDNILGGGEGADTLNGSKGDDTLRGGAGNDKLNGSTGFDLADYADATKAVSVDLSRTGAQDTGGAGLDTLSSIQGLIGSDFDDLLIGNTAANRIEGGAGDDTLVSGGGDDTLDGGDGLDVLSYADAQSPVSATLGLVDANGALLRSLEVLIGSAFNDDLNGSSGADILIGGDGHDTFHCNGGADTLTGGNGGDAFFFNGVFEANAQFPVVITDLGVNNTSADRDALHLQWVDADQTLEGDQAFVIVTAFHNVAGEFRIRYDAGEDRTYFEGDVDGDGIADLVIIALGDRQAFDNIAL